MTLLQYSGLARDLPSNIHLLTLERLDHTHHLLRLEHQAQIDEAPLNNTATIQLEVGYKQDDGYRTSLLMRTNKLETPGIG